MPEVFELQADVEAAAEAEGWKPNLTSEITPHVFKTYNNKAIVVFSPYFESSRHYESYTSSFSHALKRYDRSLKRFKSFFELPNSIHEVYGYRSEDLLDKNFKSTEYTETLKTRPIVFFDRDLKLDKGKQVDSQAFFYCVTQTKDRIVSILFYDSEKGGGCGISNGKELEAGKYHEIPVQQTADGHQFIDLSFRGGDAQFTLFAKAESGSFSNSAILRNGTNAILAAKK